MYPRDDLGGEEPRYGAGRWWSQELARRAAAAKAYADRRLTAARAGHEGARTAARVRLSQVWCGHCYGPSVGWSPTVPAGPCTCLARCPRPVCQAPPDTCPDDLSGLDPGEGQ